MTRFLPYRYSILLPLLFTALLLSPGCASLQRFGLTLDPSPADVLMYGRIPERSFDAPVALTFPMTAAWEYNAGAGFGNSAPVIVGNTLIIGTMQGELHAVDITTGKKIRSMKTFSPISSSAVVSGKFIIVGNEGEEENLLGIDTEEGIVLWRSSAGGIAASPLAVGDMVITAGLDGSLRAFRTSSGLEVWNTDTDSPLRSAPCASGDAVYCANTAGTISAHSVTDGKQRWSFRAKNGFFAGLTISDGALYAASRDSNLYVLDAATGALRYSIPAGSMLMSAPAVSNGTIFLTAMDGSVTAYSAADGVRKWTFTARNAVNTTPAVVQNAVLVTSLDEYLYALSPMDGTVLWKQHMESRIKTSPLVWKNSLIIAAEDKNIHCFR